MVRLRWFVVSLAVALALTAVSAGTASAKCSKHEKVCCGEKGVCAPGIRSVSASHVGERTVTLVAVVETPIRTEYEVWISYARCQGGAGECPKPVQTEAVGHGTASGSRARTVRQRVRNLTPGCTYVYWFLASNKEGEAESSHESFTAAGGTPGPKACNR